MKNKLALWSWILSIIGVVIYPGLQIIESLINIQRCGYPIYEPNTCATHVFTIDPIGLSTIYLMIGLALLGIIFGIISLVKISHNKNQTGKIDAIVGIILSSLLFLYGLFALAGAFFA